MQSIWLIAGAGLAMIWGISALFFAYGHARCAWFIKKTPISAIGNLTPGYAAVRGRMAARGKLLEAPITGRSCVFFLFEVSEVNVELHYSSGEVIDCQCAPWGVDDATGFAELNLKNASTQFPEKRNPLLTLDRRSGNFDRISFERAIQRYPTNQWLSGLKRFSIFGGAKSPGVTEFGFRETIIRSDDTLYVLGPVTVQEGRVMFHAGNLPFIVSNRESQNVLFRYVWHATGWLVLGLVSITASGLMIGCAK